MKKMLLIIGVLVIVACILFLLYGLLNMYGYHNLVDGTAGHYRRMHHRMNISFIVGAALAVIGAVCFVLRSRM